MATSRRRYSSKSSSKVIDEVSNISTKEEEEVVEEQVESPLEEVVQEIVEVIVTPEPAILPEITPIADPGPRFLEAIELPKPPSKPEPGVPLADSVKQKRHPRNIPRFSRIK
jgi:hypothetical protein